MRGTQGLDLYDADGKLQSALERRKPTDDFKGVTHTLATQCPNNAGNLETTDVSPNRIAMRIELPNTSLAGDLKGDKSAACFKIGFVRWRSFSLVRTSAPGVGGGGASAGNSAVPASAPGATASARGVESRGFAVAVDVCSRSGSAVTCSLTVVNKHARREAQLYAESTKLFASDSRSVPATEVVLAGVRNRGLRASHAASGSVGPR